MIIKKIRKEHERPEEGDYLAVLAYIEDLGKKNTLYGERDQVRFWWVLQQLGKDGKELVVISTYNKSLDEKANLTQAITDITGTPPGDEFDTESLIGINSRLTLKDKKKPDGHVYTDIVAILRPRKGDPVLPIPDWFKSHWDNKNTALSAAARPAPRAAVENTAATPKPIAKLSTSSEQQKKTEPVPEPPETGEWDASQYDEATSFPSSDTESDEPAA